MTMPNYAAMYKVAAMSLLGAFIATQSLAQERDAGVVVTVANMPARLYSPSAEATMPKRQTAVLLLGGSEGQLLMADDIGPQLAQLGYVSLGLRYHDGWAGSRKLANVPIEGFIEATTWLAAQPDIKRVVVLGDSRGSEAALLTGIHGKNIAGVVAYVPSAYVWSAVGSSDAKAPSGWTVAGKQLTFVPPIDGGVRVPKDYLAALAVRTSAALKDIKAATLKVEKIAAPLLILGADDDAIWPSGEMARRIEARLKLKQFSFPFTVRIYPNAGHRLVGTGPSAPSETYAWEGKSFTSNYGGTAAGNLSARTAAWAELEKFLGSIDASVSVKKP
jgi:uncharacterized protein